MKARDPTRIRPTVLLDANTSAEFGTSQGLHLHSEEAGPDGSGDNEGGSYLKYSANHK
jgi:hypothetical protein